MASLATTVAQVDPADPLQAPVIAKWSSTPRGTKKPPVIRGRHPPSFQIVLQLQESNCQEALLWEAAGLLRPQSLGYYNKSP